VPSLLVVLETDCPTCQLTVPYLNRMFDLGAEIAGLSQDSSAETERFAAAMPVRFPLQCDSNLQESKRRNPTSVPALFLLGNGGETLESSIGFAKADLNRFAALLGLPPVADIHDGNPAWKPGCASRHLEPPQETASHDAPLLRSLGEPASIVIAEDDDSYWAFGDALPVIPPTPDRVRVMMGNYNPLEIIGRIPPFYGEATIEKIAANAVMAGCRPEHMRVLIPIVRAVCDERFNAHGVQATTHFAAPLMLINGPVRGELGFHCGQNMFSNVARTNSTVGRALQLLLLNLGGARPDGIDMSALGNPGKFSFCIAENEEQSPWEPFHKGSAVSLFACDPPRGVSEHRSRTVPGVLRAISAALATIWSYRMCLGFEALVVLCPEHAKTIHADGFSKQNAIDWLFENTGIPVSEYDDSGEGTQFAANYVRTTIRGVECYRKFASPDQIRLIVGGGTAGKFSAVLGSWTTGPRGSQMVTYPIP
jgi:hypothetical protein